MHTRVRDMPRNQQKAVFANLSDDGYLARLESAEMYHRKREYLIRKGDLAEDAEDKIVRVMDDRKLTHRQKMMKIAEIRKEATKKLHSIQKVQSAPTVTGEMRQENLKRFKKKNNPVTITPVPKGIAREPFNAILMKRRLAPTSLFEHEGLLLTQKEYVQGVKQKYDLPKGARLIRQPGGIEREPFNASIIRRKPQANLYVKVDGVNLSAVTYAKAVKRNVRVRYPALKRIKLNPKGDADKDGVANAKDCEPLNPNKQDAYEKAAKKGVKLAKWGAKAYIGFARKKAKERTPAGRIKKAKEKMAKIERKKKAEQLEAEARQKEAEYRKTHPKRFGIF